MRREKSNYKIQPSWCMELLRQNLAEAMTPINNICVGLGQCFPTFLRLRSVRYAECTLFHLDKTTTQAE